MRRIIVGITVVMCAAAVVFAQGNANRAIEECTPSEARAALLALTTKDFLDEYSKFYTDFMDGEGEVEHTDFWESIVSVRNLYNADVKDDMPNCALSMRLQLSLERVLSDTMHLATLVELLSLDQSGYQFFTKDFEENGEKLGQEMAVFIQQLQELQDLSELSKE